jgi:LmbE family N-acetylglucosaminyl deacetylase
MKASPLKLLLAILFIICNSTNGYSQTENHKIRVMMIGAHPDDCEDAGGTAALFVQMGCAVKFVSVTNGDAGHQVLKGKELAKRRFDESQESAKRLGIVYDVLDNHDGLLMPTLEVRLEIIKEIREWKADIVIAPRPNDYHPDHRYTAILVQDAAFMVTVPDIAPETPALENNPVFLYYHDDFKRPNPFRPDISIDITSTYDKKMYALDAHESQVYEWLPYIYHHLGEVPKNKNDRLKWLIKTWPDQPIPLASLEKWYGKEKAAKVRHTESYEICEYGNQPDETEIKRLFPMLGN